MMLYEIMQSPLRAVMAFALIMIFARIIGKHTISRMTYYDFVASITLGAITANIAFNTHQKIGHLILTFLTFGGIAYLAAFVSLKSRKIRQWFSGKPTVVIENGKIMESNLRKINFSLDTLNQELREKDVFNIEEVEYAILEINGKLSVLLKPEYKSVTRKDLSLAGQAKPQFPVELIMDGKMMQQNLMQAGLTMEWLKEQLKTRGYALREVCYAVRGTQGQLFFDLYQDHIQHPIDQE